MSKFCRDINHDYLLYHLNSSKLLSGKEADEKFSFVEVEVSRPIHKIYSALSRRKQIKGPFSNHTKRFNDF